MPTRSSATSRDGLRPGAESAARSGTCRVVLVAGKGGVGKTTTAAATGVAAAAAGHRTLVLSTDPAHSLGEALACDLSAGDPLEVAPGLAALHVTRGRRLDPSWRAVEGWLLAVLADLDCDPVLAAELAQPPAADEVAALLEIGEQALSGRWDVLVVDCAPTTETLRLLALPEVLGRRLRPGPGTSGLLQRLAGAATGVRLPGPEVLAEVARWQERMRAVQDTLRGPGASVRLVLTPERVVLAESRRLWTALGLHGYAVDAVVVNRLLPATGRRGRDGAPEWLAAWEDSQRRTLAEARESFDGTHLVLAETTPEEPTGTDALARLAATWRTGAGDPVRPDDLVGPTDRRALEVERTDGGYALCLELPLATAEDVGLQRRGGDLVLTVGGHRRVLTLPAALQRCNVTGARVADGRLRVAFVPDERVWPRG